MNRPPHHLADHAADELLSAHLDGTVEGEERVALEEHLDACDRCRDRLTRLGAHTSALSVESLDDVTRRRLVGNALEAFDDRVVAARRRPPTWWRSPRLAAAAVVTLLMAIGLTTVLSSGGDDDADSVASGIDADGGSAVPEDVVIGDIGAFDDPAALRNYLGVAAEQVSGGVTSGESGDSATGGGAITQEGSGGTAGAGEAPAGEEEPTDASPTRSESRLSRDADARTAAERCLGALGEAMPTDAEIALVATGTFQDRPAVALVFEAGGRFAAFVAARDDCTILAFQSFPG